MLKNLPLKVFLGLFSAFSVVTGTYNSPSYASSTSAIRELEMLTKSDTPYAENSPEQPVESGTASEPRYNCLSPKPETLGESLPPPHPLTDEIQVERIVVRDSSLQQESDRIVQSYRNRIMTVGELQEEVVDKITQLYLNRGFITSRAFIKDIPNDGAGIVEIGVSEGSLEQIEILGARRVNPKYICARVQLGVGTPLNSAKLEDQLRLLRADPLFKNVEATIKPSATEQPGKSRLEVRVSEAKPYEFITTIDNYSPPSVGSERLGISGRYRNITGFGDEIAILYTRTTAGGADLLDLGYRVPVNPMNGTVQLRAAFTRNEVVQQPFKELDIRGESQLYEVSYRQSFIRTPREELALFLGFAFQNGQTFTFAGPTPFGLGPDEDGVSRTSVFKFGQEYVRRDIFGAWSFRSVFSLGTGLFDATINSNPLPDGRFLSWLAQAQRVQILNSGNLLIMQADLQLSPNGLLPSQQFVIGGGQSVRGYRQNVRAGDNGFRFSVEDRITVQRNTAGESILQVAPFIDAGAVWNVGNNPNFLQEQKFIAGVGLGLLWQPLPRLNLRVDYGFPLIKLDDRGENAQDKGFYFNVSYRF